VTSPEPTEDARSIHRPGRVTGRAALRLHLMLAGGLTLCAGAFSIEVLRALGGNTLSWLYVFEWPFFACFGIYMWRNLLNGGDTDPTSSQDAAMATIPGVTATTPDAEQDEALAAWNRYLGEMRDAELTAQDQAAYASDPAEGPLERR
jgi:hypothetical protein